jgi:hypothetical protein
MFPLEPIGIIVSGKKMTSDTGPYLWFHALLQLARGEFDAARILSQDEFDRVDWEIVCDTLHSVPQMFQVLACKQVWSIAGTNHETACWSNVSPLCPGEQVEMVSKVSNHTQNGDRR